MKQSEIDLIVGTVADKVAGTVIDLLQPILGRLDHDINGIHLTLQGIANSISNSSTEDVRSGKLEEMLAKLPEIIIAYPDERHGWGNLCDILRDMALQMKDTHDRLLQLEEIVGALHPKEG